MLVFQTNSGGKMSKTLLAFLDPHWEYPTARDAFERLVAVGALAWNAALFLPDRRQALIDETSRTIEESAGKEGAEACRAMDT